MAGRLQGAIMNRCLKAQANRVDFPAPLTPVRPTFPTRWICMEVFEQHRPPRRNETLTVESWNYQISEKVRLF